MSYSIGASGDTKEDVKLRLAAEFDKIVEGQPTHVKDRDAALAATDAFLAMVEDPPPNLEFYVSLSGSLGWRHGVADPVLFTYASVSVHTGVRLKSAPKDAQ